MLSVVIITKNEAHIIERVLDSIRDIAGDIVVVDSGSTDGTAEICRRFGARVLDHDWKGYGDAKNRGNREALNDWILSLDADEVISPTLKESLARVNTDNPLIIYRLNRKSYFSGKMIHHGVWGNDHPARLFNRNTAAWSLDEVHEKLEWKDGVKVSELKGDLVHYTAEDAGSFKEKMRKYARLNAEKYFRQGRKAGWVKRYLSAPFSFIRYFIFHLGFLDGSPGFHVCLIHAQYVFEKYALLHKLNKQTV